jgi:SNF2 family DNA or RNA helicase
MKVAHTQPFAIIYSLLKHEYLGYMIAPFAVQINSRGNLTLQYQGMTSKTSKDFSKGLDDIDIQIIKLTDALQADQIIKKFYNKKIHQNEFFLKIYDKNKGDKTLQETIDHYLDSKISQILQLIQEHQKQFFVMGTDGNPIWKPIQIMQEAVSVLFHFRRDEKETHYFPTLKFEGKKLDFQYKNALILCNEPAWMLLEDKLYHFHKNIDGNKLKPFLNKWYINIARNIEEKYFKSFVMPLVASFDVYAQGFEIQSQAFPPKAILKMSQIAKTVATSLFEEVEISDNEEDTDILFELYFQYGDYTFKAGDDKPAFVHLEKKQESYVFYRIARNLIFEKNILQTLRNKDLDLKMGKKSLTYKEALIWIEKNALLLANEDISLKQELTHKRYFVGKSEISLKINENKDWFDLEALICFGEFEIPFITLRPYILAGKKEFKLPNGEIAIIPEEWFSRYNDLFYFAEEKEQLRLQKYHLQLIKQLEQENWAEVSMHKKLAQLQNFEEIQDYPLPQNLKATLRNYQKAGYNWLRFLGEYGFGGCLADDMGLGKTLQTLAILQYEKELAEANIGTEKKPSLIVVPTSLIYNWEVEAKKFAPRLQIVVYTGSQRERALPYLHRFDVVITSYGIIRMDVEALSKILFNYIILDESQAIKNPQSNISQAVGKLRGLKKLLLTGTPIENSLLDLWSQMNFANMGLLGGQHFFRKEYLNPIEKNQDVKKIEKLHQITKPFILRRTKGQVAQDLPAKIENMNYSSMTAEQESYYEEIKSQYRNKILEQIEQHGIAKSQFLILKGLTQLRQIANHPFLVDREYQGSSGKMEDVLYKLETLMQEKKKVLVFSQFVKHLNLFRKHFEAKGWKYAYLDGATTDRQGQVELFQKNENILIFLISMKAGGVGLNLTAAEYVFLLDPWWNPAIEAQAIDRAHRIGQRHTVITYKFISKDSIEEKIVALQESKKQLANSIVGAEDGFFKSLSREDIANLLS